MDTIQERAHQMAIDLVENVQNPLESEGVKLFEDDDARNTVIQEAESYYLKHLRAAVEAERERQEWLWCAALINALGPSNINKVTTTFLGFRETLGHMSAEQLREFAGEKTHEIAAAIREEQ